MMKLSTKVFILFAFLWILLVLDVTMKPAIIENRDVSFTEFFLTERFTPTYPIPEVPNSNKNVTPIINADNETTQLILDILNRTDIRIVSQIDSITVENESETRLNCIDRAVGCVIWTGLNGDENVNFKTDMVNITFDIYVVEPEFWDFKFTSVSCYSFEKVLLHEIFHVWGYMIGDESEQFAKNGARIMAKDQGIC